MQAQQTTAVTCPECGTRLEGGFSSDLGRCMICLLRVGFDGEEKPGEASISPVPDRLGNYKIECRDDGTPWELGRGAMGVTYRAVDTSLQRPVALKLIDSEWIKRGAEARERFMREARAAAALRHPNVAAVYQFGIQEETGQYFCAMELVEGETLEMRVQRTGPLAALTTVEIALQVSSALAAAEKQGLVHRDLKPANIMLACIAPEVNDSSHGKVDETDTLVKVIDFGVAKVLAQKPAAMRLTHGGFIGTPAFASPEQFHKAPVDVRSDIFSLGATLWFLLTGDVPFPGGSLDEIRSRHQTDRLPVEQLKAARVPSRLFALLRSMLTLEPAGRPGVQDLARRLESCRADIMGRGRRVRRFALGAALVVIAIAAGLTVQRQFRRDSPQNSAAPPNVPAKSIAVLPFGSFPGEEGDPFPADGIHGDILASLSKIADLKLISRASVMQYRNESGAVRNLREIATTLGVRNVLEGNVRRVGDRLLLQVELTDALQDQLIWAERYDRSIADSVTLRGELALEIARALRARLSSEEASLVEARPTNNPQAYMLYLKANEQEDGTSTYKGLHRLRLRERLYEEALALDPDFALAHASLAFVLAYIYLDFEPTEANKTRAFAAARAALRLQPNLGEAHFAEAACLYYMEKDYERALRALSRAAALMPNNAEIAAWPGFILRRQGRWKEALEEFERALAQDPQNKSMLAAYFATHYFLRDWAGARRASARAVAVATRAPTLMLIEKNYLSIWSAGDLLPLRESLAGIPSGMDPDGGVTLARWDAAMMTRDYAAAERTVRESTSDIILMGHGTPVPKAYLLGCVALARGDVAQAQPIFEEARLRMESEAGAAPLEPFRHAQLGLLYALMQRKEEAICEGERAVELTPIGKDAIYGAQVLALLAVIYAQTFERDRAIALIERLLVTPAAVLPAFEGSITLHELRLRWHWDPLRGDPRFQKLLEGPEPATNYLASVP